MQACVAMKKPAVLMLHLVVPWLCLASAALLLASETADAQALRDYPQVKFSTVSATAETYNTFIVSVRAAMVNTAGGESNGIPVLLSENTPTYLNVTLVNKAGYSVSLKMDATRADFEAYVAGKYECRIKSGTCYSDPFSSSAATSSNGDSLIPAGDHVAGDDLEAAATTTWRLQDLDDAVSLLYLFACSKATKEDMKRGVATFDMMIASAATFPYIQRRMSSGMRDGNGVTDDSSLRGLQARWPDLSSAVQQSYQGAFAAPVKIQRRNGKSMQVDNVRRAAPLVSFLELDECDKAPQQVPMLIRSVVEEAEVGGGAPAATTCSKAEPTVQIVGPEGRCVDVPFNSYSSGKQVQLWSCNGDANQLWTLKRDGTIRSKGMCLTAKSAKAGASVVIDNCPRAPTDCVVWEVRVDGTIALGSSGLVLAVTSLNKWAGITVRVDDRGTGQSWTPTNDTAPLSAPIVGFGDLCLQADFFGAVTLAACGSGMDWAIYPDGSLRPPARLLFQWQCLAADASGKVTTKYCDWSGSACERWVFRSDGTIFNTGTGKVLAVKASATKSGSYDVVVSSATGSATQQWAVML